MRLFNKRKIYIVEYEDVYRNLNSCVVKAYDEAGAWRKVERRHCYNWEAKRCISIKEIKNVF